MGNNIQIVHRGRSFDVDLLSPYAGAFLGAFMSEGNMTENNSVKITCKDLNFINHATACVRRIFGDFAATERKPTQEHKDAQEGFHKYYSALVAKFLIEGYDITPGKRVLVNSGLPDVIMSGATSTHINEWLKAYLQMRFSGDGHVRNSRNKGRNHWIVTRRVALTKCLALDIPDYLKKEIKINHKKRKPIRGYPENIINELKSISRKNESFPREFADIKYLLGEIFGIRSKVYPYGLRCIYFDKKRRIYIASSIYKLVISRREDIERFEKNIGFAYFDAKNQDKLLNVISSYK